jgi:hypothetical protein
MAFNKIFIRSIFNNKKLVNINQIDVLAKKINKIEWLNDTLEVDVRNSKILK